MRNSNQKLVWFLGNDPIGTTALAMSNAKDQYAGQSGWVNFTAQKGFTRALKSNSVSVCLFQTRSREKKMYIVRDQ